ncbi:MAG: DUF3108 domain-containing protein [Oceanobacter sp.]
MKQASALIKGFSAFAIFIMATTYQTQAQSIQTDATHSLPSQNEKSSAPTPVQLDDIDTDNSQTRIQSKSDLLLRPYTATYQSYYRWGFMSFKITGKRRLEHLENQTWRMTFEAEASAASVDETSIFNYDGHNIRPIAYRYRASGLVREKDRTLEFDHTQKSISDKESGITSGEKWENGLQDMLSYMQQASLDLSSGKSELDYPVYDKTRIKHYKFEVVGEEKLNTQIGLLNTVKIRQIRRGKRKVNAWLAIDKDFILVQMEEKEDGDLNYRIQLVDLKLDDQLARSTHASE